ncbi:MAG: YdcF family protein [Eubacteriales bacterium]|nr:YdcF family protein [Eubacteriales bacterium]
MREYQEFMKRAADFIFVDDELQKSDIIFVPGNGYPQNAERAAQLYHLGYAPYILPSGRYSITAGEFSGVLVNKEKYNGDYETEWEFMKDVLIKNGVPEQAILCEEHATFTYENAIYSRQVTDATGIEIKKAILCCKSYHARRALMYYELLYPETEIRVSPSCTDSITKENWNQSEEGIDSVTGEIQRLFKQFSLMLDKR